MARPVGTIETPLSLLEGDVKQTLKLQGRLRSLVEKQVKVFEKALQDKDLPLTERIKITEGLAGLMDTLVKSLQQAGRFFFTPQQDSRGTGEVGESELIQELVKGGTHGGR